MLLWGVCRLVSLAPHHCCPVHFPGKVKLEPPLHSGLTLVPEAFCRPKYFQVLFLLATSSTSLVPEDAVCTARRAQGMSISVDAAFVLQDLTTLNSCSQGLTGW